MQAPKAWVKFFWIRSLVDKLLTCIRYFRETRATLSVASYARQMQFTWDQIHYLEVRPYQNVK